MCSRFLHILGGGANVSENPSQTFLKDVCNMFRHSLGCWLLLGRLEFRVTSQQQTPGSLALSTIGCDATRSLTRSNYGGVRTQMSTLTKARNLSYLYLTCIKDSKLYFIFNNKPNSVVHTRSQISTSHLLNRYQQMPITPHSTLSCMYIHLSIHS